MFLLEYQLSVCYYHDTMIIARKVEDPYTYTLQLHFIAQCVVRIGLLHRKIP